MASTLSTNYYDDYLKGKLFTIDPTYIGRLGELRSTDAAFSCIEMRYNDSIVFRSDTASKATNFYYDWACAHNPDGVLKVTLTNRNVLVDNIPGKNVTSLTFDERKADWTSPTLQMLTFNTADGTVADRFQSSSDGILQFAAGDFNDSSFVVDGITFDYYDCKPITVKVEYSPYEENFWSQLNVDEDPTLFTLPSFGYFYRGSLATVDKGSSNGWFDLRITLTDESGNTQEQVISPAFYIDSANGIKTLQTDNDVNKLDVIYNLQGRVVCHPTHGIYIKNGKKMVVR